MCKWDGVMSDLAMLDFDRCGLDLSSDGHRGCGHEMEGE